MKLFKQFFSLGLILILILALLAGGSALLPDLQEEEVTEDYSAVIDHPKLQYTLTEQSITDFEAKVAETKTRMLHVQTCEEAEAEMDLLMEEYEEFRRQKAIAEIRFYCFPTDEKATDDYLFASTATSQCYLTLVELEQEIYYANPPSRDEYFEGMTEEELEEAIKASQEMSRHNTLQSEITSEFYSN